MSRRPNRYIALTKRGARYASLLRLSPMELACLGTTYALIGRIPRKPEHLYDRSAVIESIVAADFGPVLEVVERTAA